MIAPTFIPSPHFRAGRPAPGILWIFIHTAECAEVDSAAENLALWDAKDKAHGGPPAPVSWHFAVDPDSITQSVKVGDTAWHANSPANEHGIGIELAGRASQSDADWRDSTSLAILANAAALVGGLSIELGLPLVHLDPDGLRNMRQGLAGHVDATNAWHHTNHTDPGEHFPWEMFLLAARAARNTGSLVQCA